MLQGVVSGVVVLSAFLWRIVTWRSRGESVVETLSNEEQQIGELLETLDLSLAELAVEPDPRLAIEACYHQFLRLLDRQGLTIPPRRQKEEVVGTMLNEKHRIYYILGGIAIATGILFGHRELIFLGFPFIIMAFVPLLGAKRSDTQVQLSSLLDRSSVTEGEILRVEVQVQSESPVPLLEGYYLGWLSVHRFSTQCSCRKQMGHEKTCTPAFV